MTAFISRVRIRRDDRTRRALAALLGRTAADDGGHALIWALFSAADKREFLWRDETRADRFSAIIVSSRQPEDPLGIFDLETKPYEPRLTAGDRLVFALRANAVVKRRDASGRLQKHDVAMHALRDHASGVRGPERDRIAEEAVRSWLVDEGAKRGFEPWTDSVTLLTNEQHRVRNGERKTRVRFTSFDIEGQLSVTDGDRFVETLTLGVGSARAYGCGLMLVRRP